MFYLTLPSKSSADAFHEKNIKSEFKTQLPEPVDIPCGEFVHIGDLRIDTINKQIQEKLDLRNGCDVIFEYLP